MTTMRLSRKQVIVSVSERNATSNTNFHIKFINRYFKENYSNMLADFIRVEKFSIIIITNQAASVYDMSIIEKIPKDSKNIN